MLPQPGEVRADTPDCGAPQRVAGIDVSSYQGDVDWKKVKAAGVLFAFARVSDGVDTVDGKFVANFAGMKRAGLMRGAYQYFRANADWKAQADLLLAALRKAGRVDLPPVVDVETDDGQKPEVLQTRLRNWLRRVEKRTRRHPIIYTSPSMSEKLGGRFGAFHLWIAHYQVECPTVPDGWTRWHFWQHSSTGRVPGVVGDVDLDHFAGTLRELRKLYK
jgi:lysozyme